VTEIKSREKALTERIIRASICKEFPMRAGQVFSPAAQRAGPQVDLPNIQNWGIG